MSGSRRRGGLVRRAFHHDRPDGMNDVFRRQVTGSGDNGIACGAMPDLEPDLIEFGHDGWPSNSVNRAVHATSSRQSRIGGIDNCVGGDLCNVPLNEFERGVMNSELHRGAGPSLEA